jgi:hypothetical protein
MLELVCDVSEPIGVEAMNMWLHQLDGVYPRALQPRITTSTARSQLSVCEPPQL